ncbi:MAG: transpeptidase family protein [Prevotella sp.]|nr:transpeptidase family protein [Prevotella sp.]
MSKFEKNKVMPRYFAIAVVLTLLGFAVIGKAMYIMTAEKQYWTDVAARLKADSIDVMPNRGNILSSDGQLMASSIPEYKIYIDFKAGDEKKDSILLADMDSICNGLHTIFPEKSAADFKKHMMEGYKKQSRNWPIWKKRIDYGTCAEVKKLPVFNMPRYKGGFKAEAYNARRRPFGSLAQRTVGEMYGAKDTAKCGIELSCDSILRGKIGKKHRRKVLNKYLDIPVLPPTDGADIVTTIDVTMQDIAERAVVDELKKINGDMGVAILMEVETGDVKAIVNMERLGNGYAERVNRAISYRCEPGSVFKVASFLVALDDGVVDTSYVIHTGSGVMQMHGRWMKDHNWRRGGYQDINVARTLEVSSNIGVSHVIDKYYYNNPEKYVSGLYRVGINEDLKLPIIGYLPPKIRMPEKNNRGQYTNWSKTALAWMSIGYETQIAPINTVTLYNAIANDRKMMRPRFIKKIVKNGETIQEFPPEVIKEQIAKPTTIKTMQTILEHVVSQGLGKKAGSALFKVAGKTGTAQVSQGAKGYKSGVVQYWLSFAGYFPADDPKYSCIVCLKKSGLPASGGGMSGLVFHNISEAIMAKNLKIDVADAKDSTSIMIPDVKNGNMMAAEYVLRNLDIDSDTEWEGSFAYGNPIWGKASSNETTVNLSKENTSEHIVPNVQGMGARDAVYLLENRGLKVKLVGRGKVKSQSCAAGKTAVKGTECVLILG